MRAVPMWIPVDDGERTMMSWGDHSSAPYAIRGAVFVYASEWQSDAQSLDYARKDIERLTAERDRYKAHSSSVLEARYLLSDACELLEKLRIDLVRKNAWSKDLDRLISMCESYKRRAAEADKLLPGAAANTGADGE